MSKAATDLVVVGVIMGAHGVRGDVRVKSFTAEPDALFDYAPFLSETGDVLIEPVRARPAKDHFIVSPEKPLQKEEWDQLKSTKLYVPRDALPETDEDEFYIDDLVGLAVFAGGDAQIGRVKAVLNHGAGDLIEVQPTRSGKPVLVPFTLEDVPMVDLDKGRIIVANFEIWADESKPEKDA
ncbi:MAG: ribosome maturation factor RimM [Hyphomonadaceae bacterium]|nr:ribosome maturation factor RimM [Hyphomonadaceae bacterium]